MPGLIQTGLVDTNDGGTVRMSDAGGFRFSLACDIGGTGAGSTDEAAIENISGGNGSHYDSQDGSDSTDFDQGDPNEYIISESDEASEGDGGFGVTGANGVGIDGESHISVDDNGDLPTDCAAQIVASVV